MSILTNSQSASKNGRSKMEWKIISMIQPVDTTLLHKSEGGLYLTAKNLMNVLINNLPSMFLGKCKGIIKN